MACEIYYGRVLWTERDEALWLVESLGALIESVVLIGFCSGIVFCTSLSVLFIWLTGVMEALEIADKGREIVAGWLADGNGNYEAAGKIKAEALPELCLVGREKWRLLIFFPSW